MNALAPASHAPLVLAVATRPPVVSALGRGQRPPNLSAASRNPENRGASAPEVLGPFLTLRFDRCIRGLSPHLRTRWPTSSLTI